MRPYSDVVACYGLLCCLQESYFVILIGQFSRLYFIVLPPKLCPKTEWKRQDPKLADLKLSKKYLTPHQSKKIMQDAL